MGGTVHVLGAMRYELNLVLNSTGLITSRNPHPDTVFAMLTSLQINLELNNDVPQ